MALLPVDEDDDDDALSDPLIIVSPPLFAPATVTPPPPLPPPGIVTDGMGEVQPAVVVVGGADRGEVTLEGAGPVVVDRIPVLDRSELAVDDGQVAVVVVVAVMLLVLVEKMFFIRPSSFPKEEEKPVGLLLLQDPSSEVAFSPPFS